MSEPTPALDEPVDTTHAESIEARATIHAAYQAARQRAATWEPAPYERNT